MELKAELRFMCYIQWCAETDRWLIVVLNGQCTCLKKKRTEKSKNALHEEANQDPSTRDQFWDKIDFKIVYGTVTKCINNSGIDYKLQREKAVVYPQQWWNTGLNKI